MSEDTLYYIKILGYFANWIIVPVLMVMWKAAKEINLRIDRNERDILKLQVLHEERSKDIVDIKSSLNRIQTKIDTLMQHMIGGKQ